MGIPETLESGVYGRMPKELPLIHSSVLEEGVTTEGYVRKQICLQFDRNGKKTAFTILTYTPSGNGIYPLILSLNLNGNQSLIDDENVLSSSVPPRPQRIGVPVIAKVRGKYAHRFPITDLLARGYAVATFHHDEAEPDRVSETRWGVRSLYPDIVSTEPGWGALSAWAWCLSKALDVLVLMPSIDSSQVFLYGFSRAGKATLLAGASDSRFAGVIAHASGKTGAALSLSQNGEPLWLMRMIFPHWFGIGFEAYVREEGFRTCDQDALLSAIAPRQLFVSAGCDDFWTDPRSQFDAVTKARNVYGTNSTAIAFIDLLGGHEPRKETWEQYLEKFKNTV